jgi:hypothetical protein
MLLGGISLAEEKLRRKCMKALKERVESAEGAIGYAVLWFMGVPASVLFAIFILRGCH